MAVKIHEPAVNGKPEFLVESNSSKMMFSLGDAIWLLHMARGISAFVKGGSIDVPGFHAVCAPSGMFFNVDGSIFV